VPELSTAPAPTVKGAPTDAEWYVSAKGSDLNDGVSPGSAFKSISHAISMAAATPIPGSSYTGGIVQIGAGAFVEDVTWEPRVRLRGRGQDLTIIQTPPGSVNKGVVRIDPTQPVIFGALERVTLQANGNTGQHGLYVEGTTDTGNGSGLWYSQVRHVMIRGFDGHGIWIRGGGLTTARPNQFLTLEDVVSFASTTHYALMMSGQVGQVIVDNCDLEGPGKGTGLMNFKLCRQCSDDFGATVLSAQAPYAVTFNRLTDQNSALAGMVSVAQDVTFNGPHVESCTLGFDSDGAAHASIRDGQFGATGDGGGGWALRSGSACVWELDDCDPGGATQSWITASGTINARNNSPTANYKGAGHTLQVATAAALTAAAYRTFLVNGDAGVTAIATINSNANPGELLFLNCNGGGGFALATGGNINLGSHASPLLIPAGSTATLVRMDLGPAWTLLSVS
jgi:hypothetical protein